MVYPKGQKFIFVWIEKIIKYHSYEKAMWYNAESTYFKLQKMQVGLS